MEAPEVPLEQVHEDIHHHTSAHHRPEHGGEAAWTRYIALSTAIIAALAALAALCAGHTETEAMHAKMSGNDTWSWFQADAIKQREIEGEITLLAALGHPADAKTVAKADGYGDEKKSLKAKAEEFDEESLRYLMSHTWYGYGVTMFQVAIALAAISALTRRRRYWLFSLGLGGIGIAFALYGAVLQHVVPGAATATEHGAEGRSTSAEHQGGNG